MNGAIIGTGVLMAAIVMPSIPYSNSSANFIETRLCASGRILRIELPNKEDPDPQMPMPCHAVCARDDNGGLKKSKTPQKL